MRVRFKAEGGFAFFPGLNRPVEVDTNELPEGEAAKLERRIGEARFFDLPAEVGEPQSGAADLRRYEVTVEDSARSHTVRVAEPVEDLTTSERWWRPSIREPRLRAGQRKRAARKKLFGRRGPTGLSAGRDSEKCLSLCFNW